MDPRKCICGGTSFISIKERGEIICKSCGNVTEHLDINIANNIILFILSIISFKPLIECVYKA